MTDTPPAAPSFPPPPWPEQLKAFIGDLARPYSIYAVASATAYAIATAAGSDKVGAAGLILAALYGAKTYERREEAKAGASVEIAKANAATTTDTSQ